MKAHWLLPAVAALMPGVIAQAGGHRKSCAPVVQYTYKTVCETVMVPTWVTVAKEVTCWEYRTEAKKEKVKVYKCVPVESQEEYWYVEYENHKKSRPVKVWKCEPVVTEQKYKYVEHVKREKKGTETYYECQPVVNEVDRTCTVWDRSTVKREGTRKVCKWETVQEQCQVTEDQGGWVTKCVTHLVRDCRGCCVPVTSTQKCWVSKPVTKNVTVNVCKPKWVDEKYEWNEVVCTPRQVTEKVKVTTYKTVAKTRPVTYWECVPVEKEGTCKVTSHKWTSEDKVEEYWECVPVKKKGTRKVVTYKTVEDWQEVVTHHCVAVPVKKTVHHKVCKMVPKTVTRTICVPCN